MRTSLRGICAMLAEEAIVLTTYNDGTGTMTIGAGHTAAVGAPIPRSGLTISLAEAVNIFRNDLIKTEQEVENAVRTLLSQHQFDALVSWHFNTGAVSKATLTRKLNAGNITGAVAEFANWNKSKGKVLEGLIKRRERETVMFSRGEYGDPKVRVIESKGGQEEIFTADQIEALLGSAVNSEEEKTTEELLANPMSQLLPMHRPQQSTGVTRSTLNKFRDLLPEDGLDDAVAVVAVRGYYLNTMGKEGANDRGVYDDAVFVLEPESVHNFNANTDPARFSRGVARLKSRQAIRYRPGPHGFSRKDGPYPAFRQDSNCTVIRDETGEDTDTAASRFWINLHRGGITTTSSLGCQTIPPHQWNEFKTLVDGLLKKHSQETFYYLLVDQQDVPQEELAVSVVSQTNTPPAAQPEVNPVHTLQEILTLIAMQRGRTTASRSDLLGLQEILRILTAPSALINGEVLNGKEPDALVSKSDPKLTPVNGAFGKGIGHALDGRKTAIGIIGMLATTILPIFFPQLAPVAAVAGPLLDGVATTASAAGAAVPPEAGLGRELVTAAFPIFAAITGWGTMGKIEKWVRTIRDAIPAASAS